MAKSDPTKAPEFQRVLGKLLSTPHKPQSDLKPDKGKSKPTREGGAPRTKAKPRGH